MKIVNASDVYEYAAQCRVTMQEACQRAGIAPSGPPRWRHHDVEPRLSTLRKLEQAITEIARERGTLPAEMSS